MADTPQISPEDLKAAAAVSQQAVAEVSTAKTEEERREQLPGAIERASEAHGLKLSHEDIENISEQLAPMLTDRMIEQFQEAGAFRSEPAAGGEPSPTPGSAQAAAAAEAAVAPPAAPVTPPRKPTFAERFHREDS